MTTLAFLEFALLAARSGDAPAPLRIVVDGHGRDVELVLSTAEDLQTWLVALDAPEVPLGLRAEDRDGVPGVTHTAAVPLLVTSGRPWWGLRVHLSAWEPVADPGAEATAPLPVLAASSAQAAADPVDDTAPPPLTSPGPAPLNTNGPACDGFAPRVPWLADLGSDLANMNTGQRTAAIAAVAAMVAVDGALARRAAPPLTPLVTPPPIVDPALVQVSDPAQASPDTAGSPPAPKPRTEPDPPPLVGHDAAEGRRLQRWEALAAGMAAGCPAPAAAAVSTDGWGLTLTVAAEEQVRVWGEHLGIADSLQVLVDSPRRGVVQRTTSVARTHPWDVEVRHVVTLAVPVPIPRRRLAALVTGGHAPAEAESEIS